MPSGHRDIQNECVPAPPRRWTSTAAPGTPPRCTRLWQRFGGDKEFWGRRWDCNTQCTITRWIRTTVQRNEHPPCASLETLFLKSGNKSMHRNIQTPTLRQLEDVLLAVDDFEAALLVHRADVAWNRVEGRGRAGRVALVQRRTRQEGLFATQGLTPCQSI